MNNLNEPSQTPSTNDKKVQSHELSESPKSVEVTPNTSKWAIPTIILLALVFIGAIAIYVFNNNAVIKKQPAVTQVELTATPTSSPISPISWQTYTNTKYNFSIDYPEGWNVDESNSKSGANFSSNENEVLSLYVGQKSGGYDNVPLEEYAKVAATKEVQNHNELVSYKVVHTESGTVGYETTWMVQSMGNLQGGSSESTPITYFEIPGDDTNLLRITLVKDEDLAVYENMLKTIKFTAPKNSTPIPTADEKRALETLIKKYIANKHGGEEDSYSITVSKIDGNYAQGGVSTDDGGGLWFAANEDGLWKLVWDGNGVVNCSAVSLYPNFPKTMIPLCFDETVQDAVKR